jgi:hypothetical protein
MKVCTYCTKSKHETIGTVRPKDSWRCKKNGHIIDSSNNKNICDDFKSIILK